MNHIEISDAIRYIGVDDTDIDLFESQYIVPNGVSYNSYVILDEKIAVMDTVDARKTTEWLQNLATALNGRTPDYLIISHLEPDHSGSILAFTKQYPDTTLVLSAKALAMLPQFFALPEVSCTAVKEGDTLESIVIRFYGSFDMSKVNAIQEANKMANPNALSIGQKLIIPMNQ